MKYRWLYAMIWGSLAASIGFSIPAMAQGDGNLYPSEITFRDSIEAKSVSFSIGFAAFASDSSVPVFFVCSQRGMTCEPSEVVVPQNFYGVNFPLQVTLDLDSVAPCLNLYDDDVMAEVGSPGGRITSGSFFDGYIYDSRIKGRVRVEKDTLDFGRVTVSTDDSLLLPVQIDTCGSIFRYLWPRGVKPPFSLVDSLISNPCRCHVLPRFIYYVHFWPTDAKEYIDSVYIYDPIQRDSTLLILLGEGIAASVPKNPMESVLRINPNPCDGSAAITLSDGAIEEVTVQNMLGENVVVSQPDPSEFFTLNTSQLSSGIYFVEIQSRHGQYRRRIVVSH